MGEDSKKQDQLAGASRNLNSSLPHERVCADWTWKGEDVGGSLWQRPCL